MTENLLLPALILWPALGAAACLLASRPGRLLAGVAGVALVEAALGAPVVALALGGPSISCGEWLRLDALSAWHLGMLLAVSVLASLHALSFFRAEIAADRIGIEDLRRFGSLWLGTIAAMALVLVSNNLGLLWVGLEASTLLTAFLICLHTTPASIEAMWKAIVLCSVGLALAFFGTLLMAAAAPATGGEQILFWSRLMAEPHRLDPMLAKAAFLFLLVGFGTKAGLAPMHTWLPDAYQQAPAPFSALSSGFLLNGALYAILRYQPLVEAAAGAGWTREPLLAFGLLSLGVAAAFLAGQRDLRRFLAYSSVEHLGLTVIGAGLGPAGVFAALLHALSHSLAKVTAFGCAGRLGQAAGTMDMDRLRDAARRLPPWGGGLGLSLLALVGAAPFGLFVSEFLLLRAAAGAGRWGILALTLLGLGAVFLIVLRRGIAMLWAPAPETVEAPPPESGFLPVLLIALPAGALLLLGLWLPWPLQAALLRAAAVVSGGAP